MSMLFWGFLVVIVIPLAEGVLLALLLREVHIRYPLPLGGVIVTSEMRRKARLAKRAAEKSAAKINPSNKILENKNVQETSNVQTAPPPTTNTVSAVIAPMSSPTIEGVAPIPPSPVSSEISVFDDAKNIPDHLPVSEILDSMIMAVPTDIPNDLEHRIEESARPETEIPSGIRRGMNDDMDSEDLDALAAALPKEKIDFTQELEADSIASDAISPMAKEVLGKNFDFDVLESQSAKLATLTKEGYESAEFPFDIQEDEAGTFQVSSPFVSDVPQQLMDFITPQTILSTFSDDWIQEAGSTVEAVEGDTSQFCFTEELRPMLLRKKKNS